MAGQSTSVCHLRSGLSVVRRHRSKFTLAVAYPSLLLIVRISGGPLIGQEKLGWQRRLNILVGTGRSVLLKDNNDVLEGTYRLPRYWQYLSRAIVPAVNNTMPTVVILNAFSRRKQK